MAMRTRKVDKARSVSYRERSDQYDASARAAAELRHWDAAVGNAIHAAISMTDALTVGHLGMRSASQDHAEAVKLFHQLSFAKKELDDNGSHLSMLLDLKTFAEYEDRRLREKDWEEAERRLSRFRAWAVKKLPKGA
jgi:hypothetical protein